eukprot:TRINITY_DN6960_c0_g1_i1.p1 TRINITY_DN6960_c0_g1~~TRINITY_DN6960_c0_g1_i1.p1  ORF type:complete len:449 (-),score=97.63 TRINITY_DN6960_c0_g1_i1:40-1386(-)
MEHVGKLTSWWSGNNTIKDEVIPKDHVKIIVTIFMARQLKSVDVGGRSCPYASVQFREDSTILKQYKTQYYIKTISPVWNEYFTFSAPKKKSTDQNSGLNIDVQIFSSEVFYKTKTRITAPEGTPLGKISVPLFQALDQGILWYKLTDVIPDTGQVQIEVSSSISSLQLPHMSTSTLSNPPSPSHFSTKLQWKTQPNDFVVHFDRMGGTFLAAKTVLSRKVTVRGSYPVYRVTMFAIDSIFKDRFQPWNKQYDKAQKIFGDTTQAVLVRNAIIAEHKMLYSTLQMSSGRLFNGEQFLNLINNGIRRGRRRLFTYVLLDQKLYFSETSASFFKDFLSKHSVHSNAREKVRYAGEFFVLDYKDGADGEVKYKLIIDNNSGTYAPVVEDLKLLEQAFRYNFPGINMEALDYKSEKEKEYKVKLKEGLNGSPLIGGEEEEECLEEEEEQKMN